MEGIAELLEPLDSAARKRVIQWAAEYTGVDTRRDGGGRLQPALQRAPSEFDFGTFEDVVRAAEQNDREHR